MHEPVLNALRRRISSSQLVFEDGNDNEYDLCLSLLDTEEHDHPEEVLFQRTDLFDTRFNVDRITGINLRYPSRPFGDDEPGVQQLNLASEDAERRPPLKQPKFRTPPRRRGN